MTVPLFGRLWRKVRKILTLLLHWKQNCRCQPTTEGNAAMAINYAQLKTEYLTDPTSIGYGPFVSTGNDLKLADLINTPGSGPGDRATLASEEFQAAVVAAEYGALTDPFRQLWQALLISSAQRGVPIKSPAIRSQITSIWGPATTTRSNLATLQQKSGSRAEVLFGDGTFIQPSDVARARVS